MPLAPGSLAGHQFLTVLPAPTRWEHRLCILLGLEETLLGSMGSRIPHPSEKAMAPPCSTLAWKIPWTEEPGRLCSMGSLRVGHDRATSRSRFTFMHWRRQWQPTPVFFPGESQGQEPGGLPSMGSHRV